MPATAPPPGRLAARLFDIRSGEWPKALSMAGFFFLVIATFWVLKPMKRGLMIGLYQDQPLQLWGFTFEAAAAEQLGKVLNMFVAFAAVGLFTFVVRRVPRHHLVVIVCAGFGAAFAGFSVFVDDPSAATVWSFYAFGDLFNTLLVALFWALMSDIVRKEQAKRLYGIVGLGGVLGGFVGATLVRETVSGVGRSSLLLSCIGPMVLVSLIAVHVNRLAEARGAHPAVPIKSALGSHAAWEGARLVLRSPYFLGIAGTILCYELVSNIVDFQLAASVQLTIDGDTARDEFFGLVGQISGVVSIAVQLLLTTWVIRRFGVGVALVFLPVALFIGTAGYIAFAGIAFATMMSASDNAFGYSINQSAKEALYVPATRAEKYKAKAFIDMFVQRTAKVVAVALNLAVVAFIGIANIRWLGLATLASLAIWIPLVRYLGRRFEARSDTAPAPAASVGQRTPIVAPALGK